MNLDPLAIAYTLKSSKAMGYRTLNLNKNYSQTVGLLPNVIRSTETRKDWLLCSQP